MCFQNITKLISSESIRITAIVVTSLALAIGALVTVDVAAAEPMAGASGSAELDGNGWGHN
jgi:hypothetical protein